MLEARVFCSAQPGPHLLILGGVHGDEPCGTIALTRLAQELSSGALPLLAGRVTLIPQANPAAGAANTRYTEANLNRVMRPHENPHHYEQRLANSICSYIGGADLLLDLHAVTSRSVPFTFLDWDTPQTRSWLQALGLPYALSGWDKLYPPDKDSSSSAAYAVGQGKTAVVVECGQKTDPASAEVAYAMARASLAYHGLTAPYNHAVQPTRALRLTSIGWKERDGQLLQPFTNFEAVRQGQPLARYEDGTVLQADVDGYIIMPWPTARIGEEWYCLAVDAHAL